MTINEAIESTGRTIDRLTSLEAIYRGEELKLFESARLATSQLNLKPEVLSLLEKLQLKMHKDSVGSFEELLTGIYRDVFPYEHSIGLDIEMKRQAVNLSISLIKESGHKESIHKGNGGAVDNIISTGLRFIALNRSRLRKFIVLDEADCWLEKERVPIFAHIISQLALKTNTQVVMISHHDPDNFVDKAALIRVTDGIDDGKKQLVIKEVSGKPVVWQDDQEGVRSIRLQNYMSMNDVTINLSPVMTVITGTNNSGKSAIIAGLRSMIRNEGSDTDIRHDKDKASVSADLGPEGVMTWERARSGAKKTCYTFTHNGNEIHRNEDSKTPEWMSDLGFDTQGALNIQLGTPKSPVFLLNRPASEQAAVLRVGKESEHSVKMQELYKAQLKGHQDTLKSSEKRLLVLKNNLDALKPLSVIRDSYAVIKTELPRLKAEQEQLDRGDYLVERLAVLAQQIERVSAKNKALSTDIAVPELQSTRELITIGTRLSVLKKVANITPVAPRTYEPDFHDAAPMANLTSRLESLSWINQAKPLTFSWIEPVLKDSDSMVALGTKLRNYERFKSLIKLDDIPVAPTLQSLAMIEFANRMTRFNQDIELLKTQGVDAERDYNAIMDQRDALYDELGGVCPSCEQPLAFDCAHEHRP